MGVTAADGGITPEENDDLEKREKRNKEAVKRQEPDQSTGPYEDTHNVECWRVYQRLSRILSVGDNTQASDGHVQKDKRIQRTREPQRSDGRN
jgi:hypothetical protein